MRKKIFLLLALACSTPVVLAAPTLGWIAMATIIGIPIAFAYWAIPALLLLFLISWVISRFIPFSGKGNILVAGLLSIGFLALPAIILNGKIERKAHSYVAGDHNEIVLPVEFEAIAVRSKPRWKRRSTPCDGFCLHALLSGTAERVLVIDTTDFSAAISGEEEALEFSLQKRNNCPPVTLVPGHHNLNLNVEQSGERRPVNALEEMNLRISTGECLISRKAKLGDADVVLTVGRLVRGQQHAADLGFSWTEKTEIVDRITVHSIDKNNEMFVETYRWTGVRYRPFAFAMVPGPLFGYGLDMKMGWLRRQKRINISRKYYSAPDWASFLVDTLGLDLRLGGVLQK